MRTLQGTLRPSLVFILVVQMATPLWAVAVSFSNPEDSQSYADGASMTYNGDATWAQNEQTMASIQIALMCNDARTGTYVDGESAVLSNVEAGSLTFANVNPPSMTASQYQGHSSPYFLVATPYGASQPYMVNGQVYKKVRNLGTIN